MASAAAILADARKEELEFVRPFHPVLRRPEAAFAKQYRQLAAEAWARVGAEKSFDMAELRRKSQGRPSPRWS